MTPGTVYGHVDSTRTKCVRARKISLYQIEAGPDLKLGYGFSDSNAGWSVYVPLDDFTFGETLYAKAAKLKLRNGDRCKAARSANFVLPV